MKKAASVVLSLIIVLSLAGCSLFSLGDQDPKEDPTAPQQEDPPAEQPEQPKEPTFVWVVEPKFMFDDVETINVYADAGYSGSNYLVYKDGDRYGLLDGALNIAVEAVSVQQPFLCQMDELHIISTTGDVITDVTVPADLTLPMGGHGGGSLEYVYDYENDEIYVTYDMGYVKLSEAGATGPPAYFPVRYAKMLPDEAFGGMYPEYRGDYDFCDSGGALVTRENYEYADFFYNGFAAVQKDGKYTYLNAMLAPISAFLYLPSHGELHNYKAGTVVAPAFSYRFMGGYAVVRTTEGYGVIDEQGAVVIPCTYQKILPMPGGRFAVKTGNQWGVGTIE